MKKILLAFPIIVLLAAGCGSPKTTSVPTSTQTPKPSPVATTTQVQSSGPQTFNSTTYGFQITLPGGYQFYEPLAKDSSGAFNLPTESKQFNDTVKSPQASLVMGDVIKFSDLPKTQAEACDQAKAGDGQLYNANGKPMPFVCNKQLMVFQQEVPAWPKA